MSELAFQKLIAIRLVDIDRYERIAGRIYVDDLNVSAEMVRQGAAWVYRKYAKDRNLYVLEDEARAEKRGLGVFKRLRECRRRSGGDGDLHIHTHLSLVMYHLYGFRFDLIEMLSVRQISTQPSRLGVSYISGG